MFALALIAANFTVYVGELEPRAVVIAWGQNAGSGNLIGREARSWGRGVVKVGGRSATTRSAWVRVDGLEPDTEYDYSLDLDDQRIATGHVRTWAEKATELSFLVIGDYGNGSSEQLALGRVMARLVEDRARTRHPIRFVLTTGDNVYGYSLGPLLVHSGRDDSDWWPRFFTPYRDVLGRIPFYPTPGNHDGNESESLADLSVYLDNFFFPGGAARRWYRFSYGGLADFFALDSTRNSLAGPPRPVYSPEGEQTAWLRAELARAASPWRIAYFHHSIFNAGPRHDAEQNEIRFRHWLEMLAAGGVSPVFEGHEHNFQSGAVTSRSLGISHFVTGAGGELRDRDVRARMRDANVSAWAGQRHFLLVEIRDDVLAVTPIGTRPVRPVDAAGNEVPLPFTVRRPHGR